MTIDIQRKCGGGVTQVALKCLDVIAVTDRDYSILVSEIMEAERSAAHAFDNALEVSEVTSIWLTHSTII